MLSSRSATASSRSRGFLRSDFAGALFCGAIVLVFFLVLLARDPLLFWNDDYELSILPVFADVARSWSEGNWPLLSPYSWICSNLAGEFQYGTFSVFVNAAVVLIWKLPLAFSQQAAALSLVHLFVLAVGGYLLARGRDLPRSLAIMVGLAAGLNGWVVCWGATDWFGALGAFAWLPWAWWGMERALDVSRGPYRFLWPAPFVYLLIAGGFPYTVVMLALLAAWLWIKSIAQTRSLYSIWPLAAGFLLGVGLSAPAWLALFDYLRGSAREVQDSSAHFQWIVPPAALPGFILPAWTVHWADFATRQVPHSATELACGFVPPVALLFALAFRTRALARQLKWELLLLLIVLTVSMLPTANVFRWSFRWLPLLSVIIALCAADALQLLEAGFRRSWWNVGSFAVVLLIATAGAMGLTNAAGPFGWKLFALMLILAILWAVASKLAFRPWIIPAVTFATFLATYICIPPNGGVPKYNLDQRLTEPAPLDPQRLYFSVYPAPEFSYRSEKQSTPFGMVLRPGSTSMWGGIRLINGYSPIRPAGVAREFDSAIHGEFGPWAGEYFPEWRGGANDLLARIGVDGIIVARELTVTPKPAGEWDLVYSSEEGRVYHRHGGPLERIRSLTSDESLPNEEFAHASVDKIQDSRNQVTAEVAVPASGRSAMLTFSRPYFPGYQATLDGHALPVSTFRGLTPAIEIPAGMSGKLVLRYRPWWLVAGSITAFACACIFLIGCALNRRR